MNDREVSRQGYQTIRNALMVRQSVIQERLRRVSRDLRHTEDPLDRHLDEQSIKLENDDVLAALESSMQSEMEQIVETLARLDAGAYGVCESCGNYITSERLAALPFTTRCIDCEERRESQE